jgi:hypothetical protein
MKRFAHELWIKNEEAKPVYTLDCARGGLQNLIFLSAHFGARRAFREVCPKHRNIRRESCGCDASGKDRKPSRGMATDIVLFPGGCNGTPDARPNLRSRAFSLNAPNLLRR